MISATGGTNFRRSSERPGLSKEPSSGEFFLLRNGAGPAQDLMEGTLKLENLTDGVSASAFDAVIATAEPGVSCWEGGISDSDRWYHILEGALDIILDGVTHGLVAGDSLYLESMVSHIWRNPGSEIARALVLSSSPSMKTGPAGTPI